MDVLTVVKRSSIVFPLACVVVVAMVFISEQAYWKSIDTLEKLGTMSAARTSIQGLQLSFVDVETGQRGFLLTGHKEYLEPYNAAFQNIEESLKFLELSSGKDAKTMEALGRLRALSETKLAELAATIRLYDEGKVEAAMEIILSDTGRKQMDAMRGITDKLLENEELKLAAYQKTLYQPLMLSRIGMGILSLMSLLALFMYLRQTFALKREQQERQRIVQVERERLEIEVIERTAQLTELTRHLLTAREDERNRLARNLHDDLGALLTSAKLDAARIKSRLAGKAPEALELLTHLVGILNSSIALGRDIIENLRPSALSNLGLVATLEILASEFAENSGVEIYSALEPVELEAPAELMVYRLVQEAFTNISKYASASQVWLSLTTRDGQVEVSVRDNGVGFDTSLQSSASYGLLGMRFRVEAEGGILTLVSAPGQGTLIQAMLPVSRPGTAQPPERQ